MKSKMTRSCEISEELPVYNRKDLSYTRTPPIWLSKRFLVTCLIFLGLINMSMTKLNVSIAVVEMTSKKLITEGNNTITQAEFNWDTSKVGLVLNMYEYGGMMSFLFASIPSRIGGSTAYGTFTLLLSLLTLLIPTSVYQDFRLFLLARFLIGFFDNISYGSRSEVFQHWIPITERSRLMSLSFNGLFVGTTLVHLTCGIVAHKWGWPMVFYVTGTCSLVWSIIWLTLIANDPTEDRWISKKELAHIISGTVKKPNKAVLNPYKSIFMSIPFWTLCVCRIIQGWSMTTIISCLPLYVKDATQKSTDFVGYISSIPSIVCTLMIPLAGAVMDGWKNNTKIRVTKMHKIIVGFNFFTGVILLGSAVLLSNFIVTIASFVVIRTLLSCNALVLLMVVIYMAPNHAGTISALSTFWYSLGNILSQYTIGEMTSNHRVEEWNRVFALTSVFMALGGVLFIVCGSSEPQLWSTSASDIFPDSEKKVVKKRLMSE
ncbi:vesicular glutamate transporter 2-like isoform X2 [Planococcus citri]|uniref:vesicular glutamate transporter 2-like isoform X2 n=1 Tax=Planococcus citri TaxID=170843 RepID=UPI0031F7EFEE